MPRSFSLTTHLLACGLRWPLLERVDEMRADARAACVNLVLLRIVAVQAARRLRLHGMCGKRFWRWRRRVVWVASHSLTFPATRGSQLVACFRLCGSHVKSSSTQKTRQRSHPPRKLGGVGTSHYRLSVIAATVQTSNFNASNHTTQHSRTQTPAGPSHNRGDDITSVCCEPEQTTPPSLVPSRVLHALAQSVPPTRSCSHMAPHLPFSARHRAC